MTDIDVAATDRLLTTTRSVRRRLDFSRPVPLELIEESLTVALQAPTGGNLQFWRWLVVTDPEQRARIADAYVRAWNRYKAMAPAQQYGDGDPRQRQFQPMFDSSQYLADHFAEVPALVIPCLPDVPAEGSFFTVTYLACVLPAAWSFMLAARSRGLGTTLTTLTLMHDQEMAGILELPDGIGHCALIPVAYYTGDTFQRVERLPVRTVAYLDRWHQAFPG